MKFQPIDHKNITWLTIWLQKLAYKAANNMSCEKDVKISLFLAAKEKHVHVVNNLAWFTIMSILIDVFFLAARNKEILTSFSQLMLFAALKESFCNQIVNHVIFLWSIDWNFKIRNYGAEWLSGSKDMLLIFELTIIGRFWANNPRVFSLYHQV